MATSPAANIGEVKDRLSIAVYELVMDLPLDGVKLPGFEKIEREGLNTVGELQVSPLLKNHPDVQDSITKLMSTVEYVMTEKLKSRLPEGSIGGCGIFDDDLKNMFGDLGKVIKPYLMKEVESKLDHMVESAVHNVNGEEKGRRK